MNRSWVCPKREVTPLGQCTARNDFGFVSVVLGSVGYRMSEDVRTNEWTGWMDGKVREGLCD